jgi:hypothetical protein
MTCLPRPVSFEEKRLNCPVIPYAARKFAVLNCLALYFRLAAGSIGRNGY